MSLFVQTIKKRGKIDDPRHWSDADVMSRPVFNAKEFQKKIDKAIGLSKDGHSIIKLRWTWDKECFQEYYTDWDAAGMPIKSEFRARYKYTEIDLGNGDKVEICPPRWVLEELNTAERTFVAWENSRWQTNPKTGRKVPTKPPASREGYYSFVKFIADHDANNECCARALSNNHECYGVYRNPSHFDILRLKRHWHEIQHDPNRVNPYAELSERELMQIQANTESAEKDRLEAEEKAAEERRKFYEDVVSPRKEFSLPQPTEKRTAGGIILIN